ncbi:hypothetical protein IC229_03585 [Spirosoma sp. BT702]|uniref:Uncharacterized protein n=1 Tax=Spirosoma profusum TaxID=2771354 RepID=A0A927ARG1_9BACT|nr:hypothetical protein [Spirosoma profusum]MBD2699705.1 hypothetical protein [Spirosoma profusum]
MLTTLSAFFNRISSWKTLLLAIALYVPFPIYFFKNLQLQMKDLALKAVDPIDLLFGYDPARIIEMIGCYGPEGRAVYAQGEMTIDLAYPIIYTALCCIILTLLFRNRTYAPFPLVNVFPVAVLVMDYLENACIVYLIKSYPDLSSLIASLCSIFTNLKWGLFFVVVALAVYGLIRLAIGGRQKQVA